MSGKNKPLLFKYSIIKQIVIFNIKTLCHKQNLNDKDAENKYRLYIKLCPNPIYKYISLIFDSCQNT